MIEITKKSNNVRECRACYDYENAAYRAHMGAEITGTIKLWSFFAFSFIALLANGHGII